MSVNTSRAMAPVMILSFPVASAGGRNTDVDEKFECVAQPRPHWPQKWHCGRPLCGLVMIDSRFGTHGMFSLSEACLISRS